ncbi:hypothetical protein C5B98_16130, partial [Rathayibacter sp. AY1A5]
MPRLRPAPVGRLPPVNPTRVTPVFPHPVLPRLHSPTHGAVVTFAGVVRDHDEGRGVLRLSYEAHP